MKIRIVRIKDFEWINRWAGSYTFVSCSYWGEQYDTMLRRILGVGFKNTLFIHHRGTVSFFVPKQQFENFGRSMARLTEQDQKKATGILQKLKGNTDRILKIMDRLSNKIPTQKEYEEFKIAFANHLPYHNFMKKTVDFLPQLVLEKVMSKFKEARVYSEPVYSQTEVFFRGLADRISQKEKYKSKSLTCLTAQELENYLHKRKLPVEKNLFERYQSSALFYDKKIYLSTGNDVKDIENSIIGNKLSNEITGFVAYKGIAMGTCRVIINPSHKKIFNRGDILITGMTRPEFLPFIKRANAIVTDVGGTLCHAAIISRELKIPCIIGTKIATRVLKDGDRVEVDATRGTVKKL